MRSRILVADRSPFVRLALRAALAGEAMDVVAEAATAAETLAIARVERPDVVLLELGLDPSATALAELHRDLPATALVVLAPDDDEGPAVAAIRAGACGYLPADTPPECLPAVLRGVLAGEAAIPRRLVRRLLEQSARPALPSLPAGLQAPLTTREREVLALLCDGLSDGGVGRRLGVSEVTVRRHLSTAARKLRARRRDEAVATYRRLVA